MEYFRHLVGSSGGRACSKALRSALNCWLAKRQELTRDKDSAQRYPERILKVMTSGTPECPTLDLTAFGGINCEAGCSSYYRARYYDPAPGRFLSEDPLGHTGDGPNFYSYSLNNPVNLFDPHGLQTSVGQVLLGWNRLQDWLQGAGDAGDMTSDFLLGTGPQTRDFGPGTVQVSSLVHSPGINKARNYYKKHGCDSSGNARPVSGGHPFGLKGLAESGLNPTLQYVGSYNWTITPNGNGTVTYTITDNKSMTSLLYQLWPSSWSWPRDPFHRGWSLPGGITTQTYHWTEPLDKSDCGCKK